MATGLAAQPAPPPSAPENGPGRGPRLGEEPGLGGPGGPKKPIRQGAHFRPGAGPSARERALAAIAGGPAAACVSVVVAALTWRWQAWKPVYAGLSSWQAGVTTAFLHRLQWGPQVVYTFGPLGFLEDALPFARLTAGLGLLYSLALRLGLAGLVVGALRRQWGLLGAGVAAWLSVGIAANLAEAPQLATVVALGLLLASRRLNGGSRLVLLGALGGLAGLQLLVEINTGLVCKGLAALAVVGDARRKQALAAAGAPFVLVPVLALAGAGQSFTNLASYLRGSLSIVSGYTPAMSLSSGRHLENWLALVDIALLAAVFALGLRGRPLLEKAIISIGIVGWTWELAKEGFVRHDLHDLTFFALVLAGVCLARLPRRVAPLQVGAAVAAAVMACVANGEVPLAMRSPVDSVRAIATDVADLSSTARWEAVLGAVERQSQRTGDALPGRLINALAHHSFAVEPVEDSMPSAYPQLNGWDPEPVLQAYSAYTPYLDGLDAAFLRSPRAPELILYRPVSTNGFDPAWEPPEATEAMYCRYREQMTADFWVLLRRAKDRCGQPVLIGKTVARFGEPIAVPSAPRGDMVVGRFSVTLPGLTGLEDTLWKAPAVHATTWAGAGPTTWRFVTATAGDDHVMSAPPALGWTGGYGPPQVRRLELTGGGWRAGQGSVEVSFYAVPVRPAL